MVDKGRTSEQLHLPAGFRFHPTDEELVVSYLAHKAEARPFPIPIIAEVDLYKYDPWELPEKALFGEREWYFFSPRDRKYPNGARPNRAAASGYWKATGTDKPIVQQRGGKKVGVKKALVFYKGKAPKGIKTNWIMHEYRLAESKTPLLPARKKGSLRLDDWVLCRIYKKSSGAFKAMVAPNAAAAAAGAAPAGTAPAAPKVEPRAEEELEDMLASLPDIENNSRILQHQQHQQQHHGQHQQHQQQQFGSFTTEPSGLMMEELSQHGDLSENGSGSFDHGGGNGGGGGGGGGGSFYHHPAMYATTAADMGMMTNPWAFELQQQQQQEHQLAAAMASPFRRMSQQHTVPVSSPVKIERVPSNISELLIQIQGVSKKRPRLQQDEDDVQSTCRSPAPRQRQGFGFMDLPSSQHPLLF